MQLLCPSIRQPASSPRTDLGVYQRELKHLGTKRHKSVTILTGEFPQSYTVVHLLLGLLCGMNSVSANNLQYGFAARLLWRIHKEILCIQIALAEIGVLLSCCAFV